MKKTKVLIVSLCVLLTFNSFSQREVARKTYFGIKGGINIANTTIKSGGLATTPNSLIGVTGGFFATIPASSGFEIQPELLYSGLGFKLKNSGIPRRYNYSKL